MHSLQSIIYWWAGNPISDRMVVTNSPRELKQADPLLSMATARMLLVIGSMSINVKLLLFLTTIFDWSFETSISLQTPGIKLVILQYTGCVKGKSFREKWFTYINSLKRLLFSKYFLIQELMVKMIPTMENLTIQTSVVVDMNRVAINDNMNDVFIQHLTNLVNIHATLRYFYVDSAKSHLHIITAIPARTIKVAITTDAVGRRKSVSTTWDAVNIRKYIAPPTPPVQLCYWRGHC